MSRNLIYADAIADYRGVLAAPGAILLDQGQVSAVGSVQELGHVGDAQITQIDGTVIPSLVNAHTHLDLSGVGLKPKKSFVQWVEEDVLPIRIGSDKQSIELAVQHGIELVLAGGTSLVGDIAGSMFAAKAVTESLLRGRVYLEILGQGSREREAIDHIKNIPATMGVQPHAPYSCSKTVYEAAFASGLPVATHLAETREELSCTLNNEGPLVDLAKRLGKWDASVKPWGSHPIDSILSVAGDARFLAAHINYIEDRHLELLACSNITVVYCPRASAYFGHEDHQWKSMVEAGVNVALGTDSLLCLDTKDRISVIDEMRFLYETENADPQQLFTMAMVNGAIGLGLDPELVTMSPGATAGFVSFDVTGKNPLISILESSTLPSWVVQPS